MPHIRYTSYYRSASPTCWFSSTTVLPRSTQCVRCSSPTSCSQAFDQRPNYIPCKNCVRGLISSRFHAYVCYSCLKGVFLLMMGTCSARLEKGWRPLRGLKLLFKFIFSHNTDELEVKEQSQCLSQKSNAGPLADRACALPYTQLETRPCLPYFKHCGLMCWNIDIFSFFFLLGGAIQSVRCLYLIPVYHGNRSFSIYYTQLNSESKIHPDSAGNRT